MIRLVNAREENLPPIITGTVLPLAPTATATLGPKWIAPVPGKIKAMVAVIATAGAAGNSVDLKELLKLRRRGVSGAASAVDVTQELSLIDLTLSPDYIPAAGTIIVFSGVSGNRCVKGEILEAQFTETGTIGTGTRPTFSIIGVVFEADVNLDPTC